MYFYFIAHAALAAGYPIHFFGGHAFRRYLEKNQLPLNLTLTDSGVGKLGNVGSLAGQFRLLLDFRRRQAGAMARLNEVKPDDIAYAMSDYWFDTIPLMRCRARVKILYLGMIAPTLRQVLFKSRADVTTTRLASLYYWMSQQFSLRQFRRCSSGIVTYSHPATTNPTWFMGPMAATPPPPTACRRSRKNSTSRGSAACIRKRALRICLRRCRG